MSTTSDIRVLLGDLPRYDRQTATGDGSTKDFVVAATYPIITGTVAVTIDGIAKTLGSDYTVNVEVGLVSFVAAPGNSAAIVATFQYAELSDESIAVIAGLQTNLYLAASMCARAIAGRYSNAVDKQVGDLRISYSQRAKAWTDMALKLEKTLQPIAATSPRFTATYQADKSSLDADPTLVQPFFRRETETTVDEVF